MHELKCMQERMVMCTRFKHYLVAIAFLPGITACRRDKRTRTHHDPCRRRDETDILNLDERCAEILIRPRSADRGSNRGIIPQSPAAIHVTGEQPRNIGSR